MKVFITILALTGCAAAASAQYAAQLEACLQTSHTCEQYVACRTRIAAANNREFLGSCGVDGGAK
jgi:hypothetical protein